MQVFNREDFLQQNDISFSALFYFTVFRFCGNSVQKFIGNLS